MASKKKEFASENEESSASAPRCSDSESSDTEEELEEPSSTFHRRVSTNRTLKNSVVIKEGWLLKQASSFQRWRRRYFKLQGKRLYHAKSSNSSLLEEVPLTDVSLAERGVKNANNVFQVITPSQSLILSAETRRDMEEWMSAIKAASSKEFYDVSEQLALFSGQHNWYVCSHARPTYCNICRDVLSGVASNGLSCEVCKFKAHKRCAIQAPNNCKWTTLASMGQENIIEDKDGSIHMRHQWMEGNLTVSGKCRVCDKTCGSVLRLQDWRCLWCKSMVHTQCLPHFPERCSLHPHCRFSTVPPTLFNHAENDTVLCISDPQGLATGSRRYSPSGLSPLLVFANSKSGDNQGVKFLRRFKQTLNPAQVFDLMQNGTTLGLQLFKKFDSFRVLVCGGDGSVGWVLQDLDTHNLLRKCQVGILPLGTGNDLARVLGWGSTCDADTPLANVLEKYEWASSKLLDRWSIMEYHESNVRLVPLLPPSPDPSSFAHSPPAPSSSASDTISSYEDCVASHLSRIMLSEQHCDMLRSAKTLCETIKDFVARVGLAFEHQDERQDQQRMTLKCQLLNEKLDRLLDTLHREAAEASSASRADSPRPGPSSRLDEPPPSRSGSSASVRVMPSDRRRAFIHQDLLLSRANSLKKAVRQIIEHTEKAVDEQNALQVPRPLGRRQSRSAENMVQRSVESVPGPGRDLIFRYPAIEHRPTADDYLKNCPLDLAATTSSVLPPSSELSRSRATTVSRSHPWLKSPPNRYPVPHIKKGLVTNLAAGTSLITRVLLANADAMCQFGTSSFVQSTENIALESFHERCVMSNYFGIGLDAKIALEFHHMREEHPEKCRNRTKNMMWYGVLGVKELQKRTYSHLEQRVQLECDGQRIPLPSLQGIVVLNISSYMGGANFWGGVKADDFFRAPAFDDRMLEVVAVFGTIQMAVSKVVRIQHHRIAQCRSVKITIKGDEGIPVQVDGEAWKQPPGVIHIVHKNKAQMLCRDRHFENVFKTWQHQHPSHQQSPSWRSVPDLRGPAILTEAEARLLDHFARSSARLIRCVKVATMSLPDMESDLSVLVNRAAECLDHLCPYGKLMNTEQDLVPSTKFIVNRLLSTMKEIRAASADMLHAKPEALSLAVDTAQELQAALNDLDTDIITISEAGLAVAVEDDAKSITGDSRTLRTRLLDKFRRRPADTVDFPFKYPSFAIREWTSEDVALWLSSLQLGEYKEAFISHDIRGSELVNLTRRDLRELGITKVGHLKRIQQATRDHLLNIGEGSAL